MQTKRPGALHLTMNIILLQVIEADLNQDADVKKFQIVRNFKYLYQDVPPNNFSVVSQSLLSRITMLLNLTASLSARNLFNIAIKILQYVSCGLIFSFVLSMSKNFKRQRNKHFRWGTIELIEVNICTLMVQCLLKIEYQ